MDPIHPIEPQAPTFYPIGPAKPLPPLSREERREQYRDGGDRQPADGERDDADHTPSEPWDGVERRQVPRPGPEDDGLAGPHIDISV